jgi:4-aminobutyrate aminotransferase
MATGATRGAQPGSPLSDVWFRVTDLDVVSGAGCRVTTSDGTEYLDFTSGIAVASTGHCHPHVVAAIAEQASRFIHAQVNVYRHNLLVPLADRLRAVTPDGIDTFFFTNSGAEATEAAVKLAKQTTGRPNVVVFEGSFHGRTHLTMAMTTSKVGYRSGYAPLPAGVHVAPFPGPGADTRECLGRLRKLFETVSAPEETAAVVIEPVLGEGGYLPAPPAFLEGIAALCSELGVLFVADEVQTGFGRTGTMFAVEQYDVTPDVLIMGKGIASGFPFAAVGASAPLMHRWPTGSHGGTYGGNPIGCAAAIATLDVLGAPGFLAAVRDRGVQLLEGLLELTALDAGVVDVRGLGLMVGVELASAARVTAVQRHCLDNGHLILMNAGTRGEVLRWMPPLVVSAGEIGSALDAFGNALRATA